MNAYMLAAGTLLQREVQRFVRQRSRVVGAVATPLLFWFLLGSGLGRSFRVPGVSGPDGTGLNYLQFFLPGTIILVALFTAIFSTISIIEDRREGFLQGVLASPAPRGAVVMGKLLGGALLSGVQGLVFVALFPLVHVPITLGGFLLAGAVIFLTAFGLTGLGFFFAWRSNSVQGFHAILNLVMMPMWFLSGAVFPASGAPGWLRVLMRLNPVTYGLDALHGALFGFSAWTSDGSPTGWLSVFVSVAFAVLMYVLGVAAVRRRPA